MLSTCEAAERHVETDLKFSIQRANSASYSKITYLRYEILRIFIRYSIYQTFAKEFLFLKSQSIIQGRAVIGNRNRDRSLRGIFTKIIFVSADKDSKLWLPLSIVYFSARTPFKYLIWLRRGRSPGTNYWRPYRSLEGHTTWNFKSNLQITEVVGRVFFIYQLVVTVAVQVCVLGYRCVIILGWSGTDLVLEIVESVVSTHILQRGDEETDWDDQEDFCLNALKASIFKGFQYRRLA